MSLLKSIIEKFFTKTYDAIVADFQRVRTNLEAFAKREEQKAEAYLQAHVDLQKLEAEARAIAAKARTTADNIGKLFG